MMKKGWKIVLVAGLGLLLLVLLSVAFTQTAAFRNWLRGQILSLAHQNTNAYLELGEFSGDLFTGLTVHGAALSLDGELVFSADAVELRYNPLSLPKKQIVLGKLILTHPKIYFRRSGSGAWNYQRLLKQTSDTTRAPSRFPWRIDLRSVEINNGEVTVLDSSLQEIPGGNDTSAEAVAAPYRHFAFEDINAKMSAAVSSDEIRVSVDRLNFSAPDFSTKLLQLSLTGQYAKQQLVVKNFLMQTTGSEVFLNAVVDSLQLREREGEEPSPNGEIQLELNAPVISFDEVRKFFPASPLTNGVAQLSVVVKGDLNNLRIGKADLKTAHSEMKVDGTIRNLLHPQKRSLDLTFAATVETPEVSSYLSSLELPNVAHLKAWRVAGYFKGWLDDFEASLLAESSEIGRVEAVAHLVSRGTLPQYEGKISTRRLNLGAILNEADLPTHLNVTGEIAGKGRKVEDADLVASLKVDSSEVSGQPLDRSALSLSLKERQVNGEMRLFSGQSSVRVSGTIDLRDEHIPSYDIRGAFASVNLAGVFRDSLYRSKLSGEFALSGTGRDFDGMSGHLDVNFQESDLRDRAFHGHGITVTLDQRRHTKKSIVVTSPVLEAEIEGDFHLKPFLSLVKFEVSNVLRSLKERLPFVDTTRVQTLARRGPPPSVPLIPRENLNFNYTVEVKNLTPLAVLLGEEEFQGKATINGSAVGNVDDLLLIVNASVDNFVFRGEQTKLLVTRGKAYVQADHLKPENVLDELEGKIDVSASTFILNGLRMNNLAGTVDYLHGRASFEVAALLDSTLAAETNGAIAVTASGYEATLDNLTLDYKGYVLTNTTPILATIDTTGLSVRNVELAHRVSRLSISGGVLPSREISLHLRVKDYDLSDLRYFVPIESGIGAQKPLLGLASVEGSVSGRLSDPAMEVAASVTDFRYGETAFGTLKGNAQYRAQRVSFTIDLQSSPSGSAKKPDLFVAGTVPIDLAFTHVADRAPDGPVDLRLEARSFHLALVDPFIPVFDNIDGRFSADVFVGGTMKTPMASGQMQIEDGKFLFSPNGIIYFISGTFEPKGDKILLTKLNIRNDPHDEESQGLSVSGEVTMRELSIASFDLAAQGQLLILKETARRGNTAPYGNLVLKIGEQGLRYHGSVDRSWLTGTVLVSAMSITFPPVSLVATVAPTKTISYVVVDDTTKPTVIQGTEESLTESFITGGRGEEEKYTLVARRPNTFDRLLSGMIIDVLIETQGPAMLRMIIAYSTGEELFSELSGKLLLRKDAFGTRFTGDVQVEKRSYYYFYKRFEATGRLKFDGPLDNPEMDVVATYEGFRARPRTDTVGVSLPSASKEQRVVVTLKITGTRISPKLAMEMTVDGKDWPGDVQSDAIAYILSGKFRDDLTTTERNQLATNLGTSVTSTVLTGVTSSLLSGVLTDFLRREVGGFIRQAELSYAGGSVSESADLRLTGEIGQTVIRVGGRVFNDIGNANVNIQMPVGRIIGAPKLEDLIIELERKVEGANLTTDEKKLTNGARIYYRITF
jgi:hypothetical protein